MALIPLHGQLPDHFGLYLRRDCALNSALNRRISKNVILTNDIDKICFCEARRDGYEVKCVISQTITNPWPSGTHAYSRTNTDTHTRTIKITNRDTQVVHAYKQTRKVSGAYIEDGLSSVYVRIQVGPAKHPTRVFHERCTAWFHSLSQSRP